MTLIERLRGRLVRGDFSRNVLKLVVGTGLSQGVVVVTAPILTRLFTPADYGLFAIGTSIMAILISVTCLRLEFAIPLPEDDDAAASVLVLAIIVNVAMTVLGFIVLWLFGDAILAAIGASSLGSALLLVSIGQLGGGLYSSLANWAVRTKDFTGIATTRMVQSVAMVVSQIVLGVLGLGAAGLLAGGVVGRVGGSSQLWRSMMRTHAASVRCVTRSSLVAVARRYQRFATLSTPSALLNAVGIQAPLVLFVAFYGAQDGGYYALANRICSIPLTLIASAVGQVFLAEAARNAHTQPHATRGLYLRTTRSLLRMGIGPTILLMLVAPVIAGPLLGQDWATTGLYVAIMAPMSLVAFVATATGDGIYALERLDLQLLREIVRLVGLGGAVPLAAAIGLSATGAVALLSVMGSIVYVAYAAIMWWAFIAQTRAKARAGASEQPPDHAVTADTDSNI
jgi:O-antigen/teichoic acid export membrane protein